MSVKNIIQYNYATFSAMEYFGVLPYNFDLKTGDVQIEKRLRPTLLYWFVRTLSILHTIHLVSRCIYTLLFDNELTKDLEAVMLVVVIAFTMIQYGASTALGSRRDLIAIFLNNGVILKAKNFERCHRTRLTLYELLAKYFPFLINGLDLIYAFLYIVYPNFPILLVASVPAEWRNPLTTFLCLILDTVGLVLYISFCNLFLFGVIIFIVSFREDIQLDMKALTNGGVDLKAPPEEMDDDEDEYDDDQIGGSGSSEELDSSGTSEMRVVVKSDSEPDSSSPGFDGGVTSVVPESPAQLTLGACSDLVESRLRVLLFNLGVSSLVYLAKLLCQVAAVGGGFVAIRFMSTDGLLALLAVSASFCAIVGYIGAFNEAFQITGDVDQFKMLIMLKAQEIRDPAPRREVKMRLRSITQIAIRQGAVHMERASTPSFVNFIISQIVDLLITFA